MLYKNSIEGQKLLIAINDCNKCIEMKKKFCKYFDQLDKYKNGEKNELKIQEIDLIEQKGFESYCKMMINKFCKFSEKFDIVSSYIIHDLKIEISTEELKNGINIDNYLK